MHFLHICTKCYFYILTKIENLKLYSLHNWSELPKDPLGMLRVVI